jgi:hypothetical protein
MAILSGARRHRTARGSVLVGLGTSTMMARARTAVLLLLVLAGGVVAACGEDGPDARVTRPATALVVGDSILHHATEEMRAELKQPAGRR